MPGVTDMQFREDLHCLWILHRNSDRSGKRTQRVFFFFLVLYGTPRQEQTLAESVSEMSMALKKAEELKKKFMKRTDLERRVLKKIERKRKK